MNIWKFMAAFGAFAGWIENASKDGEIDINELTQLAIMILQVFGLTDKVKIKVDAGALPQ